MTRTIVTLEEADKRWLDRYSGRHSQSTAQTIRLAIKEFQAKAQTEGYRQAIQSTAGLLRGGEDSVQAVRRLRREWD